VKAQEIILVTSRNTRVKRRLHEITDHFIDFAKQLILYFYRHRPIYSVSEKNAPTLKRYSSKL